MEYTINQLARLAGVSARTLRYYDEIALLKPVRINSSGYRIYGSCEVDRLQQILFYKALGVPLEQIATLLRDPKFDALHALKQHHQALLMRRDQLEQLILTVERSIEAKEGDIQMSDKDKFEGLKKQLIEENDQKYGQEVREKYGDEAYEASQKAFKHMSEADYEKMNALGESILSGLAQLIGESTARSQAPDPTCEGAQAIANMHKTWIGMAWGSYNPDAHLGVVEMYAADPRFTAFYDKSGAGATILLKDAVTHMIMSALEE